MLSKKDLDKIEALIDSKLDSKLESKLNEKLKFLPSKEEFYRKMDELMGEIKAVREEQKVISGYKDQIEDHETRIGKV
ncbi:hypothetical protein MUP32_00425 [Candidatus Microgenomates bacterium]|nr:hypothetical protein [Candidatus Microgenomates bacterium]